MEQTTDRGNNMDEAGKPHTQQTPHVLTHKWKLNNEKIWTQFVMLPSLCPCVLIVQHPPMSENMRCFIFCSCVSLLRMVFSRCIHVPTEDTDSSFLMTA